MAFDPQAHQDRQTLIRAATIRRKLKGLPEEKNITILYNEICAILELPIIEISSLNADHLPAPHEMKNVQGDFMVPRKDCPLCGSRDSVILTPLCGSCKDAEGGKFKSAWVCQGAQCKDKEGGYKERSEKAFVQWLSELGIKIPTGSKMDLGIKTMTDSGLK